MTLLFPHQAVSMLRRIKEGVSKGHRKRKNEGVTLLLVNTSKQNHIKSKRHRLIGSSWTKDYCSYFETQTVHRCSLSGFKVHYYYYILDFTGNKYE